MLIVISSRMHERTGRAFVRWRNERTWYCWVRVEVLTLLFTSGIVIDAARIRTENDIPRGCILAGIKVAWYKRATAEKSYKRGTDGALVAAGPEESGRVIRDKPKAIDRQLQYPAEFLSPFPAAKCEAPLWKVFVQPFRERGLILKYPEFH